MASLFSWLTSKQGESTSRPTTSSKLLPDSHKGTSTSAANQQVEREIEHQSKQRRKRGKYHHYDAEIRAKIAKHTCECGNKRAAIKFTRTPDQ